MKTNFNLRRKNCNGETLILLVIRYDNNKLQYSTKESIHPRYWETDKKKRNFQRAIDSKSFPEHPEFNARLNFIEAVAHNAYRQFLNDNNKPPSVEELRELLNIRFGRFEQKERMDLFDFIKQLISDAKTRFNTKTGKQLARTTIVIYQNAFNVLKNYSWKKFKCQSVQA